MSTYEYSTYHVIKIYERVLRKTFVNFIADNNILCDNMVLGRGVVARGVGSWGGGGLAGGALPRCSVIFMI